MMLRVLKLLISSAGTQICGRNGPAAALVEAQLATDPMCRISFIFYSDGEQTSSFVWEGLCAGFCYPHIFMENGLVTVFLATMSEKMCG